MRHLPRRPKTLWRALSIPALAALLLALPTRPAAADAITVLSVAPGDANVGSVLVSPDPSDFKALAAAFDLTSAFSDVAISVALTCLQCQAQFYLMDAIGPGADFASSVQAVATVDTLGGGGFINQATPLFAGLHLDIGTHYLVMALTSNTISGAIWSATQAPLVTGVAGAANLGDFMASTAGYNSTTPPLSDFSPYQVGGTDTFLQFSLTSGSKPVPEPATWLLMITGVTVLTGASIRRRARH